MYAQQSAYAVPFKQVGESCTLSIELRTLSTEDPSTCVIRPAGDRPS
jgi:hypothetical protein